MAKQKGDGEEGSVGLNSFEARLTNLLALLLVKGMGSQAEQISELNRAGFKTSEIASLLGKTPNTVSVVLYQQKKPKKK